MKSLKNKKGFTLIELLAVIVILAIVMVVTIPSVLNAMDNAKKGQLDNASETVSSWLTKQNSLKELGADFGMTDSVYDDFIEAYGEFSDTFENAVKEGKKLSNCSDESYLMLNTAGVADPENNINLDKSYIWKNASEEKIYVKLSAKEGGAFYVGGSSSSSEEQGPAILSEFKIYGNSVQNGTPSSTNPVEIKSVGNPSKNLYVMPSADYTLQSDGSYYVKIKTLYTNAFKYYFNDVNKQYTFSAKIKGAITSTSGNVAPENLYVGIGIQYSDNSKSLEKFSGKELNNDGFIAKSITSDISKNVSNSYFIYSCNAENYVYVKDIQLEEGSSATSYEPHYDGYKIPITITTNGTPTTITLTLDEPLRKVGDTSDYIDLLQGKVYRNVQVNDTTGTKSISESYQAVTDTTGTAISIPTLPEINKSTTVTIGTQISSSIDLNFLDY